MTVYYYNKNPNHTQFRLAKEGDRYYLERMDNPYGSGYIRLGHFEIPSPKQTVREEVE